MDEQEQAEILYRLDERTRNIENNIDGVRERLDDHGEEIAENKARSSKIQTKINIASYVLGAGVTALLAHLAGVIPI